MENKSTSTVCIKSNVNLKSKGVNTPIDLMPRGNFDRRLEQFLTTLQGVQKQKYMFWAERVCDENGNPIEDNCYKSCENCSSASNCQRPRRL